jgi:toxin ParE1/3/4
MLVIWRTEAMEDLEAARNYIAQDNPAAAERLFDRIMTTVDRLQDLPSMGRPGRVAGTRELVVPRTPYIVAYFITGDHLEIAAVLHGARQWPDQI